MKIGLIGLGKMGGNLAHNLKDHGYDVVVYNRSTDKTDAFISLGFKGAHRLEDFLNLLGENKIILLMIPAGEEVDKMINKILPHLNAGDIIIDGGNSFYKDSIRRYEMLKSENISYIDMGTSGGVEGARYGACLMIGGDYEIYESLEHIFKSIAVKDGYSYMGPSGTGHYVKMVHNGIEYGMMQAIAEGFEVLDSSKFDFDYEKISKVWNNGSIISSYLMEMVQNGFSNNGNKLEEIKDQIDSSGEGLWTVLEALELGIPLYNIAGSLFKRFESKQGERFGNKVVASMRNEFGGHKIHKK